MVGRQKQKRMQKISTFTQAVDALGGDAPVAQWLNTTPGNIATMRWRGYLAQGYHLQFYLTLRDRGFDPAPAVFGLTSFGSALMPKLRRRRRSKHNGSPQRASIAV